jgi:hypothetical protein
MSTVAFLPDWLKHFDCGTYLCTQNHPCCRIRVCGTRPVPEKKHPFWLLLNNFPFFQSRPTFLCLRINLPIKPISIGFELRRLRLVFLFSKVTEGRRWRIQERRRCSIFAYKTLGRRSLVTCSQHVCWMCVCAVIHGTLFEYMFEIEIWKNMIDEYHRRLRTIFGCT